MKNRPFKFRVWDKLTKKFTPPWTNIETIANNDEFVVQQYIGMDDMYDKEIYEGDILEYYIGEGYNSHGPYYIEIRYERFRFCKVEVGSDDTDNLYYIEDSRVVGNIFELPEYYEQYKNRNKR